MNTQKIDTWTSRLLTALAFAAFAAFVLSSCGGGNYETDNVTEVPIHRFVDREAGVVCFWFSYTRSGGIDCLPISETQLEQER